MRKTAIAAFVFLGMGGAASYGMTDGYFLQPRNEFTPEVAEQPERLRFTPVEARRPMRRHPNKFTPKEDGQLATLVAQFGSNNWRQVSKGMPGRNPRQCRERWFHYLDPKLMEEDFTLEEDLILLEKYNIFGPRWAIIRGFFPGRTDIQIRNRYCLLERREERIETAFQQHLANSLTDTRTEQAHQEAPEEGPSSHPPDEESQSSSEEAFQSPLFEGPSQLLSDEFPFNYNPYDDL